MTDVIVAGLGAMGSALAYHLARQGLRVLGLDRYRPPHAHGSSHGETRVIREAYFEHPSYVPLVRRACALWEALERESGAPLLCRTGALMLGAPGGELVRGTLRSAQEHGIACEQLDAAEVRRRFPALRPDPGMVGIHELRGGVLDAEGCVAAHLRLAEAAGAVLRYDEPLEAWHAGDGAVEVTTARGRYRAPRLALCTGAWLPGLMPELPLAVERQVQLWFAPRRDGRDFGPDRLPVFLAETDGDALHYGIPDLGRGVKLARHHGGETGRGPDVRAEVDARDVEPVRRFARRYAPDLDGEPLRAAVCRYTNTPDGHFLADCHPAGPNVWVVSACSGHGFKFASALGETVALRLAGSDAGADLSHFSARRLQTP
jgi:sarcosine oxidase